MPSISKALSAPQPNSPSPVLWTLHAVGIGAAVFYLFSYLSKLYGGPLITPDSLEYLKWSKEPWRAFGDYYPSGTSWLLYIGDRLTFGQGKVLALLSGVTGAVLFAALRSYFSFLVSLAATIALLLWPEMALVQLSVWSETGFFLLTFFLAWLLSRSQLTPLSLISCLLAFVALCETRHGGLFFLPALAVAITISHSNIGDLLTFILKFVFWSSLLLLSWMVLNQYRTGHYATVSHQSVHCKHYLAAYAPLNYCRELRELSICNTREKRRFLRAYADNVQVLQHNSLSPLNQVDVTPEHLCQDWQEVKNWIRNGNIGAAANIALSHFIMQLSPWKMAEVGLPQSGAEIEDSRVRLENLTLSSNEISTWIGLFGLIGASFHLICYRQRSNPVVAFLVFAGLGYAAGIALNNPFSVLRYALVPRLLFVVAGLITLGGRRPSEVAHQLTVWHGRA